MNHHEEAPRPPAGPRPESEALPAPWAEAAAVLQAEQDADVHQEARDLAVAEMAAVTLTDRISALSPGASVEIALVDSWTVVGEVEHATSDHLLLRDVQGPVLLPAHAIASISSLPHVMHNDATKPVRTTWRSVLREYFGRGTSRVARHAGAHYQRVTESGLGVITFRFALSGMKSPALGLRSAPCVYRQVISRLARLLSSSTGLLAMNDRVWSYIRSM